MRQIFRFWWLPVSFSYLQNNWGCSLGVASTSDADCEIFRLELVQAPSFNITLRVTAVVIRENARLDI